eukprot:860563-Karenia_brevis.AAC.1
MQRWRPFNLGATLGTTSRRRASAANSSGRDNATPIRLAGNATMGNFLPEDKPKKHVNHPYTVKGLNDEIDLSSIVAAATAKASSKKS